MARQKEEEMKVATVKFRVTLDELLSIDERAFELNITRSELARRLVLDRELTVYDFSGLDELSAQIGKIGNNINQIARVLNEGNSLDQENAEYLKTALTVINKSVQKFYEETLKGG